MFDFYVSLLCWFRLKILLSFEARADNIIGRSTLIWSYIWTTLYNRKGLVTYFNIEMPPHRITFLFGSMAHYLHHMVEQFRQRQFLYFFHIFSLNSFYICDKTWYTHRSTEQQQCLDLNKALDSTTDKYRTDTF